jgi:hypothetical protein
MTKLQYEEKPVCIYNQGWKIHPQKYKARQSKCKCMKRKPKQPNQ